MKDVIFSLLPTGEMGLKRKKRSQAHDGYAEVYRAEKQRSLYALYGQLRPSCAPWLICSRGKVKQAYAPRLPVIFHVLHEKENWER